MRKAVFVLLLAGLCSAAFAQNDLVIKKTSDMKIPGLNVGDLMSKSGASSVRKSRTSTIMVKGSRLRMDSVVPKFSLFQPGSATRELSYIQQCDLGRTVHLNRNKKSYSISSIAGGSPEKRRMEEKTAKDRKGGIVDVSIEVSDTNERKNMFGFVAKHLKSTMTLTPGPGACMKQPMTLVDEGWYTELPTYACEIQTEDTLSSMQETDEGCADEIRIKPGFNGHLGFPLEQTRTMTVNGMSVQFIENVISLERANLDAALFEIPSDYHPSNDSDVAESTGPQSNTNNAPPNSSPSNGQPQNPSNQYPPDWQNKPLPQMAQIADMATGMAKQPGVIRIGVITPTTDMGQGFEGFDAGQVVQSALLEKLKADKIESVPITSGVLIQEEAKMKQCDYLLYVDVKRKKGGGGFLKQMIITNLACMGGNAACAAATGAGVSGRIKNKDEITFEYHVNKPDGSSALSPTTLKKKAEKDGDDVLAPMIGEASANVINAIKK
jgi:hypothetical protein